MRGIVVDWRLALHREIAPESLSTAREVSTVRRSASKVLDAKPFALKFRIALHPEGCPDKGPKIS